MSKLRNRNRQKTKPEQAIRTTPAQTPYSYNFYSLDSTSQYCDDSELERLNKMEEEQSEEDANEIDMDYMEMEEDDSPEDDKNELDPFFPHEARLNSMYRGIWIWKGKHLIWCASSKHHNPFSIQRERLRMLIEKATLSINSREYFNYFLQEHFKGKEITPVDASGIFRSSWFGDNIITAFHRMAIVIPEATTPIYPIGCFFGDGRGDGLPQQFEMLWLKARLNHHECPDLFTRKRISLQEGKTGDWLFNEYCILIKRFQQFVTDISEACGITLPQKTFNIKMNFDTFQKKKISQWKSNFKEGKL
jgi:hypothetical protein